VGLGANPEIRMVLLDYVRYSSCQPLASWRSEISSMCVIVTPLKKVFFFFLVRGLPRASIRRIIQDRSIDAIQ